MADIVTILMEDGYKNGYDLAHTTALVHFGQFFFDSIHTDERNAFSEKNNFLRFFYHFAKCFSQNKFGKDELNNLCIKDQALKDTIISMFEGITRKLPAFNFLKFVF